MKVELFTGWQGFKKGEIIESSEILAGYLVRKSIGKIVDSKDSTTPKKRSTSKPRKPKNRS